jgi:hypothetical protein
MIQLPSLEERIKKTANLLHPVIPQAALQDIKDAALSFYLKLVAVDKYKPTSTYLGPAVLIKALGNRSAQALGEDYQLSQVCKQKVVIHGIEGAHHRSVIDFPAVEKVAQIINSC